ncbi:uncharacterized protein BCR38DRAFT_136579 [Pseudomassariella vexata]|uniref:Uncharacterized protein n=1 Tax=Pseudomassariella vexata TaxID=1141098 RepID=A0A1Y2EAV0_9PEZI|nr:uncharacterized protein BCR38DRAFT_136579 [Pseudomassariella vexata]ORY68682.1 hypothetical protein BCR38DRAFT_136579 [Pseudomassariella vexata]
MPSKDDQPMQPKLHVPYSDPQFGIRVSAACCWSFAGPFHNATGSKCRLRPRKLTSRLPAQSGWTNVAVRERCNWHLLHATRASLLSNTLASLALSRDLSSNEVVMNGRTIGHHCFDWSIHPLNLGIYNIEPSLIVLPCNFAGRPGAAHPRHRLCPLARWLLDCEWFSNARAVMAGYACDFLVSDRAPAGGVTTKMLCAFVQALRRRPFLVSLTLIHIDTPRCLVTRELYLSSIVL